MSPETLALLTTYGIPALAFLVGHSQLLAPLINKAAGILGIVSVLAPKKPTDPAVRPFGQGGVIDLLGILFSQVVAHPTLTPDEKARAISGIAGAGTIVSKPVA